MGEQCKQLGNRSIQSILFSVYTTISGVVILSVSVVVGFVVGGLASLGITWAVLRHRYIYTVNNVRVPV